MLVTQHELELDMHYGLLRKKNGKKKNNLKGKKGNKNKKKSKNT